MKATPLTNALYDYIVDNFAPEDDLLREIVADAEKNGVPQIHISPMQGKFLQLLIHMIGAKKVLEVGSLFGYSAIWMAQALPEDGKVISLELEPKHAQLIRKNAAKAGLSDKIDVRQGDANALLPTLIKEAPFDLAFIDADKTGYVDYVDHALRLVRKGGVIIGDNALAHGKVWDATGGEESGFVLPIRKFNHRMATEPRLVSLLIPIGDGMCVGFVE
jgi:caffeoyl-CoA O-methyltransferase